MNENILIKEIWFSVEFQIITCSVFLLGIYIGSLIKPHRYHEKIFREIIKSTKPKEAINGDRMEIEYLPHCERYFPKVNDRYLYWWNTKQNYSLEKNISGCEWSDSKEGATKILKKYQNLNGIETQILKVDL